MSEPTSDDLLSRGVSEIIDRTNLESRLRSQTPLRVKLGIDPTSSNLHLGRSIPLLKLRDFQLAGHQAIFIVGDFTARIGDTSDKESERPALSEDEVKENLNTYLEQVEKIVDVNKAEIHYNSEWLKNLNYSEICRQANAFSVNSFISRENISRRLKVGGRVSLREVLYPLMQGYDSVAVKAEVEIGGTDQRFNLLAGRELQRLYGQTPQDLIICPLVEGTDGRKMSSSWGNTVNLNDSPNDMFAKVMKVSDNLIIKYWEWITRVDLAKIAEYENKLKEGVNPRDVKLELAREIVSRYHNEKQADQAHDYFVATFSEKMTPDNPPQFKPSNYDLLSVLVESELVPSRGEARRLVEQGGVKVGGFIINDPNHKLNSGDILQKGKAHFLKLS